jgi:periplasmic protein TonB
MFDGTLNSSWNERSRRGLTALTSFGLQALAVGVLLILPLLRPTGLPLLRPLSTPVSLEQPLAEAAAARPHASSNPAASSTAPEIFLRFPHEIPHSVPTSGDDGPPQISGGYIPGASETSGGSNGLLGPAGGTRPIMPVAPAPLAVAIHISHMSEGDLVHKVLPSYPPLARSARIQGQVVLQAVISKKGAIENLKVLTGPMLVPSAIEAVRQWRYRPYVLNNEPVEVETQITVNFSLAGN